MHDPLVRKVFFALLLPSLMINLVTSVASSADSIIVGNFVGEAALAAITLTFPVFMIINTLAALIAVGGSVVMSVFRGRGDAEAANLVFSHAVFAALGAGVLAAILSLPLIDPIARALGARDEGVPLVAAYAGIILLATPLFILNTALAFFVRNEGRPVLSMLGLFAGIAANIVMDLIFVAGFGMGVAGAAWATDLSQVVSLVILLSHFISPANRLRLRLSFSLRRLGQILGGGIGTSLDFVYQAVAILVLNNFLVGLAGHDGIVVYTVVLKTGLFALSLFEGLSQTMQPMVSVFHGEANPRSIRATMRLALRTALAGSLFLVLVFEIFPGLLSDVFGLRETGLHAAAVTATRLYAPAIVLMTGNVLMSYYYQSIERVRFSVLIVLCRSLVLLLGCTMLLGSLFGLNGVWTGFIISEALTMALWLTLALYRRRPGQDLLLLDPVDEKRVFDERFAADAGILHQVLVRIQAFLGENGVESGRAAKVMLAVDELATNLLTHDAADSARNLEVRIVIEKEILLLVRDDGRGFDPSAAVSEVQPGIAGGKGLFLVRGMADAFEYRPVFGMNRTLLRFA